MDSDESDVSIVENSSLDSSEEESEKKSSSFLIPTSSDHESDTEMSSEDWPSYLDTPDGTKPKIGPGGSTLLCNTATSKISDPNNIEDQIEPLHSLSKELKVKGEEAGDCIVVQESRIKKEELEDSTLSIDTDEFCTPPEEVAKRMSLKTPRHHQNNGTTRSTEKIHGKNLTNVFNQSFVDLTQESVPSLENSPVGARCLPEEKNSRKLDDIVAELSNVNHDIDSKQTIIETINLNNLPDNGKNLLKQIKELTQHKVVLEEELKRNRQFPAQKAGLEALALSNNAVKEEFDISSFIEPQSTKVSESSSSSNSEEEIEAIDESLATGAPVWGDLPQPDMTLSGLGKAALQTHFTQKSLTVETLSKLHSELNSCPSEDMEEEDPKGLKVDLMPHQKHALAWMLWRERGTPSGGILADDMGLGKTLSMIALILRAFEVEEDTSFNSNDSENVRPNWMQSKSSEMVEGGTLVVCPASLLAQWEKEIHKRTKRGILLVEMYHGSNRTSKPRKLGRADVVLTTYNLLGRESGLDTSKSATKMKSKGPLFYIKWDRIILDEAHIVRNHKSLMARAVCELEAKHRWCLTGTPIHNKEVDLYALLKFLRCSPFDDLTVWKRWVDNKDQTGMKRLNTMMKSLLLRRTKEQLQKKGELRSLPEKTNEIINVDLDVEELEVYEKIAEYSRTLFAQFLGQRAEKQQMLDARYGFSTMPTWKQTNRPDDQFQTTEELVTLHRRMQGLTEVKSFEILLLLLRLRQACCHPHLVTKMVTDVDVGTMEGSENDNDLASKMNLLNIGDVHLPNCDPGVIAEDIRKRAQIMSLDNPVFSLDRPSAKVRATLELLEEKVLGTDDKAIIVSQWTSFLSIISKYLIERDVKCDTLSGEIPVLKRQDIVDSFNRSHSGPQILLLSLTAGGVGLNLVGANHLLLVDIHWNPQLEAQASDRIYRVGQKKPVYIYRFITRNTIEERVKTMQDSKLALAADVLTGSMNSKASKLTLEDLKMLFSFGAPIQSRPDFPNAGE